MTIGFTGTRQGLSRAQARQLQYVLALLRHADRAVDRKTVFVDGDCPEGGADQEARELAVALGCDALPKPPSNRSAAAMLNRDREIARECHVLIAAPLTDEEQLRSGTWATVRYARKAEKPVVMLTRGAD